MLTINVVQKQDYNEINEFLKQFNKEDIFTGKSINDDEILMVAREGEETLGVGIIKLWEEYADIENIITKPEEDEIQLDYGIGKALLNFIDRRSIKNVYCHNLELQELLKKLSFKNTKKDGIIIWHLNLENYFTDDCCSKCSIN